MKDADHQHIDKALWSLLKKGDENAFAELFEAHHRALYNYGLKLLPGSPGTVEDAIQDLFIDIWRLRGSLTNEISSVRFYLYRSLRRKVCLAAKRNPFLPSVPIDANTLSISEKSPESLVIRDESLHIRNARLREVLDKLPDRQLEAITLKYLEGFEIAEIARIMEVNEKSVRNFLYKGLCTLKSHKNWLELSPEALFGMATLLTLYP
ncbi:sigma-70 family RNA polymerase sigma factor [Ravibacter arvi]|uniref:Sigma-70 family RNA polymerase sigma factor n=1 Tax=Ravibacter arvi TaxID=2051041 RepID=A0ABP8LVV4_9BACT